MTLTENSSAAHLLEGTDLPDGWKVLEKIKRKPNSTGGHFSVGYEVRHADGRNAFLKVIDYSEAFAEPDFAVAMNKLTTAFIFERDLMLRCGQRKMKRIVRAIGSGNFKLPGFPGINQISYLIFEHADEDVRNRINGLQNLDFPWALRSMHEIGVGLRQLHQNEIVHQDLKPSNVLIFESVGSKITDLGRAWAKGQPSHIDNLAIPGDHNYSPPEYFYHKLDSQESRYLGDIYLYGSMLFMLFSQTPALTALKIKLHKGPNAALLNDTWENDLPFLQHAFEESLQNLSKDLGTVDKYFRDELVIIAAQLCQPDPTKRGDHLSPKRYNLERYISRFDLLARLAETKRRPR